MPLAHGGADAVIFDMDGLLVDSEPFWRRVEIGVFDAIGVDIRPLIGRGLTMGMRVDEVVAFFRSRLGFAGPADAELADRIVSGMVDAMNREAQLMPGALDALALCEQNGLKVALASGSTPPVIDAVLARFGLRERFAAVCSAAHVDLGKPHPAIFLRAAAKLGTDPSRCVVLEDSLNGCIAAKAARMGVIAVPDARHAGDPRFAIADLVLASLTELAGDLAGELLGLAALSR